MEFITLTEPGIGHVIVRHAEIVLIEPTAYCYSRIHISTGILKIVEESPLNILARIHLAEKLTEPADSEKNHTESINNVSTQSPEF